MNKEEKNAVIEDLSNKFNSSNCFYITDFLGLTVDEVNQLRKICYEKGVEYRVAKNTLILKAIEKSNNEFDSQLNDILKGPSSLFFSEIANLPAKILKNFRKNHNLPIIKAAYIDSEIYIGDEQLDYLANLKSKEELIGEIIGLLRSPISNVLQALKSGEHKLSGVIKTLSNKET